jgi:hypothetical protein
MNADKTGFVVCALEQPLFRTDNMRGFAEVYWWFLGDGRVPRGLPTTGVEPQDFERACQANHTKQK